MLSAGVCVHWRECSANGERRGILNTTAVCLVFPIVRGDEGESWNTNIESFLLASGTLNRAVTAADGNERVGEGEEEEGEAEGSKVHTEGEKRRSYLPRGVRKKREGSTNSADAGEGSGEEEEEEAEEEEEEDEEEQGEEEEVRGAAEEEKQHVPFSSSAVPSLSLSLSLSLCFSK
jgi:hypothetical protein